MSDTLPTKKSLGQHWLQDESVLTEIAESVSVSADDVVLEIGPGPGTLTKILAERAKQVVAVELDGELAARLRTMGLPNVEVIQQDILQFDLTSLSAGYKVVANIPYYLTGNLLRLLCASPNPFSRAALLVQKEVAQRVAAKPGAMSLLSVSVQFYCEVSLGQVVPAEFFTPPPKVDSQILILKYRAEPLFPDVDVSQFFRLVKAGFAQRRKTLGNSVSGGLRIGRDQAAELLAAADISPTVRAQTLTLEQWHKLYQTFAPLLSQVNT